MLIEVQNNDNSLLYFTSSMSSTLHMLLFGATSRVGSSMAPVTSHQCKKTQTLGVASISLVNLACRPNDESNPIYFGFGKARLHSHIAGAFQCPSDVP
eukprot:5861286-Amphidinium_carterae.1